VYLRAWKQKIILYNSKIFVIQFSVYVKVCTRSGVHAEGAQQQLLNGIFISHCNENSIYAFPEKELSGLSPNFHIHVSVSDLYRMQTIN
jgi:hypothetical protein